MNGDIAVVTGAAGDIGRAIALELAATHAAVMMADIDGEAIHRTAGMLGGPDRFVPFRCDITSEQDVASMAAAAGDLGAVLTLVNNAGGASGASLHATTADIWRQDISLNLEGAFLCFRAFERELKKTKGSVINIASVNGIGVYGHPAYSTAKAGLIHLTRLIAVEYGKDGIRANAVAPGTVRTRAWEARAAANPDVFEEARYWYPLQRVVLPEEVAKAVSFLASPQASAITGVVLPVDCGLTAGQAAPARTFSQSEDYR